MHIQWIVNIQWIHIFNNYEKFIILDLEKNL